MTPTSPIRAPTNRRRVNVSSDRNKGARTTDKIGIVPKRMPASPLSIYCWPQAMVPKGIAAVNRPSQNRAIYP